MQRGPGTQRTKGRKRQEMGRPRARERRGACGRRRKGQASGSGGLSCWQKSTRILQRSYTQIQYRAEKTEPKRRALQGESWTAERPSPFPRSVGLHGGLDSTRSAPDHVCEEWGPDRAEPLGMVLDAEQPPVVSFQRFNDTVWCVA